MGKKEVLIIGASIRGCALEETLVDNVRKIDDESALYEYIEGAARGGKVSNTEGCGIAVSYGILKEKYVTPKYLRLNEYIDKQGNINDQEGLIARIADADGYVFLSPVYFGDRSSLLHDLFMLIKKKGLRLDGKVSAMVSVGAKRNGGQETTNIYSLNYLLQMGSLVVGNGPPTSQYGGTAVGGNMGTMDNDYFGIMTSMGVGTRVSKAVCLSQIISTTKPKISFWVLEDFPDRRLLEYLREKISFLPKNADWNIIDIVENRFNKCLACNECPGRKEGGLYKCVIHGDDMKSIQDDLLDSDGVIVCGLNYENEEQKLSNYQRFIERTRYIRRDNFKLTDKIFMPWSLNELFADSSYDLRVLTAFLRQNTILHNGIRNFMISEQLVSPDINKTLESFITACSKSAEYRKNNLSQKNVYESIGY